MLTGTYLAKKQDGSIYFRSSITYKNKHISLGSFQNEQDAHLCYIEANNLLTSDTSLEAFFLNSKLSFDKWVSLINFRDHNVYFKNPIYLKKSYFCYYFSPHDFLIFDFEDLFYYSQHKIMKRKGHLFVADYGMQVTLMNRYGVKNYGVKDKDYRFVNGNPNDFRYHNIEILNSYHGVSKKIKQSKTMFQAKIHINGNIIIGIYDTEEKAAIAYNKAIDLLKTIGIEKNFTQNYLENVTALNYAEIYTALQLSPNFKKMLLQNGFPIERKSILK
ncbi:MAG: hypothetical protein PHY47_17340 [Lachnospiraceae bacterium]|nr:hypothetical protein [Lachnospiraceae bacterium]